MAPFDFHTMSDGPSNALKAAIVGKTIVVTGVSPNSLGAKTARSIIAQKPAQLILASQTEAKLQEVIKSLDIPEGTTVRPLVLDLASLESVRRAAKEVSDHVTSINALICTAGIMAVPSYNQSKDGIELQFAVNHLGQFSFVNLLIEKLIAGNATVVTYTSEAHTRANPTFLDDLTYDNGQDYEKWTACSNSKLCNIAHAAGLAKRYGPRGLQAFSVDPGIIVTTALTRSVPQEDFIAMGWVDANGNLSSAIKTKTSAEGSSTGIIAAFDRSLSNDNGILLADGTLTEDGLLPAAIESGLVDKLWKISDELVNKSL